MRRVSMATRDELLVAVSERYRVSDRVEKVPPPRRVCRGDGIPSQARDARASCWSVRQACGATAVAADLWRRRARSAHRAVGGVGPRLWQAAEGNHTDADRGDGAPRTFNTGV